MESGILNLTSPFYLMIPLALMALIPFMAVMGTSFLKLVVVFSILRNATGLQQIPPNIAMNALAIILTLYIMAPVGYEMYERIQPETLNFEDLSWIETVQDGITPYREFLKANTTAEERNFFLKSARLLWPSRYQTELSADDLMILLPSFCISELTKAFQIGFLLYLPFIIIDLIVSNILLAMGMMMVSPMTISLPFKLLLFVLLEGWTRLIHSLVLSYS
ncbi:type III secretion system export apparatus subunit SctR [Endozoicomonas gorgoniicola]|uniref:Type III secretion system export apparatus subunit SctR n=1 Tax=Endozoicomonas gorgoniicola TaxID=1234144 RepID=A0ABT3MXB1_9GAMM|nr:type III secretion system export apparatus subunit SctR [Endozoicomonas gorgoniicola]MCW7554002.1 type III secretion system export apparatus subunit SctR [Endozoicomonas gorgoniicola]